MAVPKKKVSRSRRNMRRYSSNKQLAPVSVTRDMLTGDTVRTHTISLKKGEIFDYAKYSEARKKAVKTAKPTKAPKAKKAKPAASATT